MTWSFGWSDVIALGALVVAVLSWFDSRRRISQAEIRFAVETTNERDRYLVRHVGTKTVKSARIDLNALAGYEVDGLPFTPVMRPGDSITLWIRSSRGFLPEEIELHFGRRGVRVIPFPQTGSGHQST
ncbi:amidohydrolase [Microbacterium sp. HM58-2]|nr:amidohydrolase [Microbacterium sp. HM58-2]